MNTFIAFLISIILISCGSDDNENLKIKELSIQDFLQQNDAKLNDGSKFTLEKNAIDLSTGCLYQIEENHFFNLTRTPDEAVVKIESTKKNISDNLNCDLNANETSTKKEVTYKLSEYKKALLEKINQTINPQLFCKDQVWCLSVTEVLRENVIYKGKESLFIQTSFTTPEEKSFVRKSWISKSNLFLNVYEYELFEANNLSKSIWFQRWIK